MMFAKPSEDWGVQGIAVGIWYLLQLHYEAILENWEKALLIPRLEVTRPLDIIVYYTYHRSGNLAKRSLFRSRVDSFVRNKW
jgi:hypothetical protein